jgi:hypothetical protein
VPSAVPTARQPGPGRSARAAAVVAAGTRSPEERIASARRREHEALLALNSRIRASEERHLTADRRFRIFEAQLDTTRARFEAFRSGRGGA